MTEPQRLALYDAARRALGDEEGGTLMALTPPANTDIATMQGLERVEERLDARMSALEERLNARIVQAVSDASAALSKQMHASELRTMGVVLVAVIGSRFIS